MVTSAVRARIQASLRRHRPHSVKVYRTDSDEPMTITPTGERSRWERVVQSVPPTAERIELLDKGGGTIFALDIEQPDAPVAESQQFSPQAMLNLLIRAQEMALDRQSASIKVMTDAYATLAKMLAERLTSLEKGYSQVLSAAFESTLMAAEAQAKLNGEVEKGENHSAIDQMAAEVIGKLIGGVGDKPAASVVQKKLDNGTRVKAASVVQKEV